MAFAAGFHFDEHFADAAFGADANFGAHAFGVGIHGLRLRSELDPLKRREQVISYRRPIGMGYPRTPVTEILREAAAFDCLTAALSGRDADVPAGGTCLSGARSFLFLRAI
jgi:hypothetical protein